jgi:hypothetical protein
VISRGAQADPLAAATSGAYERLAFVFCLYLYFTKLEWFPTPKYFWFYFVWNVEVGASVGELDT